MINGYQLTNLKKYNENASPYGLVLALRARSRPMDSDNIVIKCAADFFSG